MKSIGLLLLTVFLLQGVCFAEEDIIQKITVLGNNKIEEGVVRGAIKSREGQPFSIDRVREDLRAIFLLGYFTDVQVDIKPMPQGKEVIFIVVEKPSVKDVLVTGNDKIKLDDIKEKLTVQTRTILNLEKINESAEQIRKLYFSKGYYGVKVDPAIDYTETNEAIVTFRITEGPKGRVQKITFVGNETIKSSQLKKVMTTKEWTIFSFLTKGGVLDEDTLKNDAQMLTAYYIDQGHLDVKISEPKIDLSNPTRIRINITVSEGPRYRFADIEFKGDVLTTKEALFQTIKIRRDAFYSNTAIRADIARLTELFANKGYAYVEVSPETAANHEDLTVNLTFTVEKKTKVYFERIQITGNLKSRDKVVRRELQVAEGDLYDASALNMSRSRLRKLGFFKEVNFATSAGSTPDKINLDIKVEEAPTGSVSFGVGYSSLYKLLGSVTVSDRNLFGLGYNALARVRLGEDSRDIRLSFTDPYFLGHSYSLGADLYNEQVGVFDTYSYKVFGGDIRSGKDLTPWLRLELMYKLENLNVYDVQPGAGLYIREQEGSQTTSAISGTLIWDTRDDYFAPSRGSRQTLFGQFAGGPLQGSNDFVKGIIDSNWYFPLPLGMVLNLRGRIGDIEDYGGKSTPINERFFVGGIGTVRGYEYGKAGPLDPNGDPIGANRMVAFNSEIIFPLSREIGLRGAVFYDIGKGFNSYNGQQITINGVEVKSGGLIPLKQGIGVGLRWFSPFGPLAIDVGWPLNPSKTDKNYVIDLNAGTVF